MAYQNLRFQTSYLQFTESNHLLTNGATAGRPCGTSTKRILRRCIFKLKSRERQLISDSTPAVSARFPTPNAIAIALPDAVRFTPFVSESMVCNPCQPCKPCNVVMAIAETTMLI